MQLIDVVGPNLESMRPMHPHPEKGNEKDFPVYPRLVEKLAGPATYPDDVVAHALAVCAGYAYGDGHTVSTMMARLGLAENHCLVVDEDVDAMFIRSTAFLVQSKCGRVAVLCYRGTRPAELMNWLTDADTSPNAVAMFRDSSQRCDVHAGFYRNVRATRCEVVTALERALNGKSVLQHPEAAGLKTDRMESPLEVLYVTGHSLGGAMAALMAVMLATDPDYQPLLAKLKGVYTYGQPMVGNTAFARECSRLSELHDGLIRYVFRGDPVPALPPLVAGDYAHFGREIRLGVDAGHYHASEPVSPTTQLLVEEALQFIPAAIAPATQLRDLGSFRYGPGDHGPQNYIAALTPVTATTTEFGDDAFAPVRHSPTRLAWTWGLVSQLGRVYGTRAWNGVRSLIGGAQDEVRHLAIPERPLSPPQPPVDHPPS